MKKIPLFLLIASIVILSGCTSNTNTNKPFQYSNNVVTTENYLVTTTNPYPGTTTSISFNVKNNGDKPVETKVDFFNVPGSGWSLQLFCNDVKQNDGVLECNQDLAQFESKPVKLVLTVPTQNIQSPVPFTIAYSIGYEWNGTRSASIPIIDGITKAIPVSKFSQSVQTYGPIAVEFGAPVGRTYKVNNQVITERWGYADRPFEITMDFKHVGNPSGDLQPLIIKPGSIKMTLNNMKLADDPIYCAFDKADLTNIKKVDVPSQVSCNMVQDTATNSPEVTGIVSIDYNYNYTFTKSETIIVQPNPQ